MAKTTADTLAKALGIENLSLEAKTEILNKVDKRLDEVLLRVLVENLSEEEAKNLRGVIAKDENIEDKVAEITSRIPMFSEKIEHAIAEEIATIRKVLLS